MNAVKKTKVKKNKWSFNVQEALCYCPSVHMEHPANEEEEEEYGTSIHKHLNNCSIFLSKFMFRLFFPTVLCHFLVQMMKRHSFRQYVEHIIQCYNIAVHTHFILFNILFPVKCNVSSSCDYFFQYKNFWALSN